MTWRAIGAIVLLIMGCLFVLVELESPTSAYWTGTHVEGYTQRGLTWYTYRGTSYTLTDSRQEADDTRRIPTEVYFKSSDPSDGYRANFTRWVDAFMVLVWFVAAGVLLLAELRHRQRVRRRPNKSAWGDPRPIPQ